MLRNWRIRNGWTQYTASQWGKEAGFKAIAPGNLSNIEHGKQGNLTPATLFHLAELNCRVADQDWGTVRSRGLMDQLELSKPIAYSNGKPWGPTEFWSCSVGLLAVPEELASPEPEPVPRITEEQARQLSEQWRKEWKDALLTHDLDPGEALAALGRHIPKEHRRRLTQLLVADALYDAAELKATWENGWLPAKALQQWKLQDLPLERN